MKFGNGERSARQIARATGRKRHEIKRELAEGQASHRRRIFRYTLIALLSIVCAVSVLMAWASIELIFQDFFKPAIRSDRQLSVSAKVTKTKLPASVAINLKKIISELERERQPDRWLMERHPVDLTFDHDYAVAKQLTRDVNQAFAQHQSIPVVADMRKEFGGHFYTSFLLAVGDGAMTRFLGRSREEVEKISRDESRHEVAIYSRSVLGNPRLHGSFLVYDREWRALLIPAIDFSDPGWLDALVIHEMYHGWCLRRNLPSSQAPMLSNAWIAEELAAHELESRVLDDSTAGRYSRRLGEIVGRSKSKSLDDFLAGLTAADVRSLDELFAPAGKLEGALRTAQYFLNLSLTWIDSQGGQNSAAKIRAYRALIQLR